MLGLRGDGKIPVGQVILDDLLSNAWKTGSKPVPNRFFQSFPSLKWNKCEVEKNGPTGTDLTQKVEKTSSKPVLNRLRWSPLIPIISSWKNHGLYIEQYLYTFMTGPIRTMLCLVQLCLNEADTFKSISILIYWDIEQEIYRQESDLMPMVII